MTLDKYYKRKSDCKYFIKGYELNGAKFGSVCRLKISLYKEGKIQPRELICRQACSKWEEKSKPKIKVR